MQKTELKYVHENVVVQEKLGARFFSFIPHYTQHSKTYELYKIYDVLEDKTSYAYPEQKSEYKKSGDDVFVAPDVWKNALEPFYNLMQKPTAYPNELANKVFHNITNIDLHESLALMQMNSGKLGTKIIKDKPHYIVPEAFLTGVVDYTKEFARLSAKEGTANDNFNALKFLVITKSNYDRFPLTQLFGINSDLSKEVDGAHETRLFYHDRRVKKLASITP